MRDQPLVMEGEGCKPKRIQSVERAAAILEIIAQQGGSARLLTIAEHTGLKKSTAHNILATLDSLGYVRRSTTDTWYHLGERIMNLSRTVGDDNLLRNRLRPALEGISARTNETVYLAAPSGDQICYLDAIEIAETLKEGSRLGSRAPIAGSAIGLIFLSFMPGLLQRVVAANSATLKDDIGSEIDSVIARGCAFDAQKVRPDINCVAIPVFDRGRVCASIGLRASSDRLGKERLFETAWMMREQLGKVMSRGPVA